MIEVLKFKCFKNIGKFLKLKTSNISKLQAFQITGVSYTPKVFYVIFMTWVIQRLNKCKPW